MIKKTFAISLWVVAIGLWMPIVTPQNTNPYQELYEEVLAPVVKIRANGATGSGVVIPCPKRTGTSLYILTAAHVVGDESTVQVYIYNYKYDSPVVTIESATVVITDTIKDLALLRIPDGQGLPMVATIYSARLAPRDYTPYLFTEVYAVGCSLGFNPRPSEGIVSAVSNTEWEISAPILPGNSGGGVFLKSTHELIGIAVWVRVYHGQLVTTMAGIVPINQIHNFLEKFKGLRIKGLKGQELKGQIFNPLNYETFKLSSSGFVLGGVRTRWAHAKGPEQLIDLTERKGVKKYGTRISSQSRKIDGRLSS